MDVQDDEKDELEKLQWVFGVFADIQASDDSAQSCDSDQFEQAEHRQEFVASLCDKE